MPPRTCNSPYGLLSIFGPQDGDVVLITSHAKIRTAGGAVAETWSTGERSGWWAKVCDGRGGGVRRFAAGVLRRPRGLDGGESAVVHGLDSTARHSRRSPTHGDQRPGRERVHAPHYRKRGGGSGVRPGCGPRRLAGGRAGQGARPMGEGGAAPVAAVDGVGGAETGRTAGWSSRPPAVQPDAGLGRQP